MVSLINGGWAGRRFLTSWELSTLFLGGSLLRWPRHLVVTIRRNIWTLASDTAFVNSTKISTNIETSTRPSILCVTQKRAFMPLYIVLGQHRACMPVYIGKSGDLVGWHRCLTDRQTTEDRATQLLYSIQFKLSHAILMCNLSGVLSRGKCGKRIVRSSSREILKKIVATLLSKVDEYIVVYICKNLAARYHTFRTVLFKRTVFWRLMY